ncbi:MAG: RpiB/LacA/LacB family sugar-phosphate isomerase [Candidatus Woesearchaeota archaeon]|nr:RpiB/LacA/LacB family sugar-phosphate isomerase [Candidatus Woesearchaeota archaeon]
MIYLGSDHGGYELKEHIMRYLLKKKNEVEDLGNVEYQPKDDYPDFAFSVAIRVGKEDSPKMRWENRPKGILFCRSSGGMVIAANKVKNVRAVSCSDVKSAEHARRDNDANVIALPGDWLTTKKAEKIIDAFLETEFTKAERHVRRIKRISDYEK